MPDSRADVDRRRALHRYRVVGSSPDRVLDRVAGVAARALNASMGLVSMVDEREIWFGGTYGIDPGVRSIPRGQNLCEPVISGQATHVEVHDALADPRLVDNRFVGDFSIRSYACAPIITDDGHRIGSVAVMSTEPASLTASQLALLEDLATIVMEQLELRLLSLRELSMERHERRSAESARDTARHDRDRARRDRDGADADRVTAQRGHREAIRDRDIAERDRDVVEEFAAVLQQTLLPPSLPEIEGLEAAAYYHPADPRQVGGDFYDVFSLGDDRLAFFIGDVQGHGAGAAVATSLIRYTLRSAALHHRDPTDVLKELNAVMLREADPRRFCTVMLGTLRPDHDGDGFAVTIATGGHLPVLLVDPDSGAVEPVRPEIGMLVGATPRARFGSCTAHLRRGQTLVFYTDGLVEARRGATPFDEEALAAFIRERAHLPSARLLEELVTLIPKLEPEDDVAVLTIAAT